MKSRSHNHMFKFAVVGFGLLMFLASCGDATSDNITESGAWTSRAGVDTCKVANIVDQYYNSGEYTDIPQNYGALFGLTGESPMLQLQYQNSDYDLLDYIIHHKKFAIHSNCKTEIVLTDTNGQPPSDISFQLLSNSSGKFCKLTPFWELSRGYDGEKIYGHVQSCIDVSSGNKSFKVIYE